MIRGYFATTGTRRRPFVHAVCAFPALRRPFEVPLLVDTGADRTVISPLDAHRLSRALGMQLTTLAKGPPSTGIGGRMDTYIIDAVLTLGTFTTPLRLTILDPTSSLPIPSLLGRDILSRFALFVEERTDRVLLLDPAEADALQLP